MINATEARELTNKKLEEQNIQKQKNLSLLEEDISKEIIKITESGESILEYTVCTEYSNVNDKRKNPAKFIYDKAIIDLLEDNGYNVKVGTPYQDSLSGVYFIKLIIEW